METARYQIEGDVCADDDSNCNWEVYACANTEAELREEASVSKINQDGGEVCTVGYDDAPGYVQRGIDRMIAREIEQTGREERDRLVESLLPIARMAQEASKIDVNDFLGRIQLVVLLSAMAGLANVALEHAKKRETV